MSSGFNLDTEALMKSLTGMDSKMWAALEIYADTSAQLLESSAKDNARWENRTGEARRRLRGSSGRVAKGFQLTLAHGVDYGIFLELAMEKRYSIIPETIDRVGTFEIMPGLKNLMDKLR